MVIGSLGLGGTAVTYGVGTAAWAIQYHAQYLLSVPNAAGQCTIFIMATLCSRCGHYIFVFFLHSFFSSPNLSGRRMAVYHTSTHDVVLLRI